MTKKDKPLPDVLPWEERKPSKSHSALATVLIVLAAVSFVVGYEAGLRNDPVNTNTNNTNSTSHSNGNSGSNSNASLPGIPPVTVTGIVFLPSTWIISGTQYQLKFSVQFWATLVPRWNNVSGWFTAYSVLVPPENYNVSLPGCSPLKLVDVYHQSDGSLGWSPIGYPSWTSVVSPTGSRYEADFECGLL